MNRTIKDLIKMVLGPYLILGLLYACGRLGLSVNPRGATFLAAYWPWMLGLVVYAVSGGVLAWSLRISDQTFRDKRFVPVAGVQFPVFLAVAFFLRYWLFILSEKTYQMEYAAALLIGIQAYLLVRGILERKRSKTSGT